MHQIPPRGCPEGVRSGSGCPEGGCLILACSKPGNSLRDACSEKIFQMRQDSGKY